MRTLIDGNLFAGYYPAGIKSTDCSMMSSRAKAGNPASLRGRPQWTSTRPSRLVVKDRSAGSRSQGSGHSRGEQHPDLRGERKFERGGGENYLRVERAYGSFARSFTLANTVNSDAIKAEFRMAVLTLTIRRKKKPSRKHIKVNVATSGDGRVRLPGGNVAECCSEAVNYGLAGMPAPLFKIWA